MQMKQVFLVVAGFVALGSIGSADAQTSSLYGNEGQSSAYNFAPEDQQAVRRDDNTPRLNRAVPRYTLAYSRRPEPREYAVGDLVTIVVREQFDTELDAELTTDESSGVKGGIYEMPRITLSDLVDMQLRPNTFSEGNPLVDIELESEYDGSGEYERSETMTGRITAQVVDVRPNGNLVLEARKTMTNDDEEVVILVTGIASIDDITPEGTVLSSEMAMFDIRKNHEGELRKSTQKSLLTRIMEFFFAP